MEPIIETYTGKHFHLFDASVEDIDIADITHALGLLCRYNGHTRSFYSVAEHSVMCSYLVPEEFAFDALMHDASEAYLSDIPKPFKSSIGNYQEIEAAMQSRIAEKFGFTAPEPQEVKNVDVGILWLEAQALITSKGSWWHPQIKEAFDKYIDVRKLPDGGLPLWSPVYAQLMFEHRFKQLTGEN
jgi:hypothetical protein